MNINKTLEKDFSHIGANLPTELLKTVQTNRLKGNPLEEFVQQKSQCAQGVKGQNVIHFFISEFVGLIFSKSDNFFEEEKLFSS